MADIQKILFEVELENDRFKVNAKETATAIKGIGNSAETSSSGFAKLKNGFNLASVAIKGFMGLQVAKQLYNIGEASVSAAAQMEQQKVAFTTLLGSAEKAQVLLDKLQEFAASTPFQFNEIVDASKKLIAFGFSADQVEGTLRRVGDVASGLNIPLGELVEIYGKARTQNTLYNEDINQLAGRGIPVFEELGKILNVDTDQVKKLSSEGKITFPTLEQMFKNLTSEGGKFAGMMDAQSQTLSGGWSNFNDELDKTQLLLGNKILGDAKNVVAISSDLLSIFNAFLEKQNEANQSQLKWVGTLETGRAFLEDYPDKLVAIIKRGGENAEIAKKYADYLAGNIKLSENEVAVIQQKLQLNRDLIAIQTELTQAEKDRQDARHRDAAAFLGTDKKKDDKSLYKAQKADAVAFYTTIGDLEKASTTSIQNEQEKQLANAKRMYWQKKITKAEYEESIKQIELNYTKQIADAQEQIRQESLNKEVAATYEKFDKMQSAYEKYSGFVLGLTGQLSELVSMAANNEIANIENNSQKKIDAMNAEYEHQIALIDASSLSEEQKAAKKKALDEQLARDEKAINEKAAKDKREAQIKAAKASKAIQLFDAVVSTPAAAMQAFRSINMPLQPWTFPLAIGAAAATTALGLAKVKLIADQPLPSFDVGALNIPKDMTAKIHKGEMIIPKPFAESVRSGEATVGGGSGGINIYVQGSVIDSQGLLAIVDSAQKEKASLLGATTYTYKSAYR
jgi:tape measure domain-containing protein